MAQKLKKYVFPTTSAQSKYPWAEWLDGGVWQLETGADYDCEVDVMKGKCKSAGRKRGLRVTCHANDAGLAIQAHEADDATKARWAARQKEINERIRAKAREKRLAAAAS